MTARSQSGRFRSGRRSTEEVVASFWARTVKRGDCIEWTGATDDNGYGRLRVDGRTVYASRWIYEHTYGLVGDLDVMHSCDNPPCVNLAHLSAGTRARNLGDMAARDRSLFGERAHGSKLTNQLVQEIRERYSAGETTIELAAEFNVTRHLIGDIAMGRAWRRAPGPITTSPFAKEPIEPGGRPLSHMDAR